MGEISQYRPGNKAPNNGVYIEKAKREVVVRGPQQVELNTG
ncbi:YjzC family protein [Ornithinibacillus scapharcae]|nr:YjzC family protein [Ornithinibacillus scapharcae]